MKKIITLSFILFGTVFLAGCGQQQVNQTQPINKPTSQSQSNTNPTTTVSDFKKYTNDQYGFEINYPSSAIYTEQKVDNMLFAVVFSDDEPRNLSTPLMLFRVSKSEYQTIADYKTEQVNYKCPPNTPENICPKETYSDTFVFGVPAVITERNEYRPKAIAFIKDGLLYRIAGNPLKSGFDTDQLLSNLKFTK